MADYEVLNTQATRLLRANGWHVIDTCDQDSVILTFVRAHGPDVTDTVWFKDDGSADACRATRVASGPAESVVDAVLTWLT